MKGVVLAAGKGSRLAALKLQHKSFAVVQKKHLIDYSLDLLIGDNPAHPLVDEIVIVVGFNSQVIIDYIGDSYNGVPVKYAYQSEQKGVAHAMMVASPLIDDDAIMCLADEILFNSRLEAMIEFFEREELSCVCGVVINKDDLSGKPIGYTLDGHGFVSKVSEKPSFYENEIRGVGECIFKRETFSLLEKLKPNSKRGEYEMGDWIQSIISTFGKVKCFELASGYANVNYPKDIDDLNSQP